MLCLGWGWGPPTQDAVDDLDAKTDDILLRLNALGVQHVRLGTEDKAPAAGAILAELGLDWSAAAAMGDDWPDLPLMRRAALACAPVTAHAEVLAIAHFVPQRAPGAGAVRDVCDLLLVASGAYARELEAASR